MLSRGRVWPGSCILDSSIAAKSRGRDSRCAVGAIFAFPGSGCMTAYPELTLWSTLQRFCNQGVLPMPQKTIFPATCSSRAGSADEITPKLPVCP